MDKEFWEKWVNANQIEKEKLIASLPMFKNIICPLFSPSLLNSYFEDLFCYVRFNNENYDDH